MSDHPDFHEGASRQIYKAPYSSRHPVPNVRGYEQTLQNRQNDSRHERQTDETSAGPHTVSSLIDTAKDHLHRSNNEAGYHSTVQQPYESQSRNHEALYQGEADRSSPSPALCHEGSSPPALGQEDRDDMQKGNSPRQGRVNTDPTHKDQRSREVTDPVTHLPILIHDSTSAELESVPENEAPTNCAPHSEDDDHLSQDDMKQHVGHRGMKALFPPPNLEATGHRLASIMRTGLTVGLSFLLAISSLSVISSHLYQARGQSQRDHGQTWAWSLSLPFTVVSLFIQSVLGTFLVFGIRAWIEKKTLAIWDDEVWAVARTHEEGDSANPVPESVHWLNSCLTSVWPLINPDLFTSLADTLEDVMQASLPKLVRMISVDDFGQGNEAIRILGIRWLPPGNAKKDVLGDDDVQEGTTVHENDSDASKDGEKVEHDNDNDHQGDKAVPERMEAEEGDFVNVEVGFSYRASSIGKSIRVRAKSAHLYLVFYLPGGIQLRKFAALDRRRTRD